MSTTTWRAAGAALVAVALAAGMVGVWACGDDDGSGRNPDAGDGDSGREDSGVPGSAWIGRWVYISGTSTTECPGAAPTEKGLGGEFEIVQRNPGELEVVEEQCAIRCVEGTDELTALPGQRCTSTQPQNGVVAVLHLSRAVYSAVSETEIELIKEAEIELQSGGTSVHCMARVAGRAGRAADQ